MGAWGHGAFENDSAQDWVGELEEGINLAPIAAALTAATAAADDYVDAAVGCQAIAAAEVVAALRGHPVKDLPDEVLDWLRRRRKFDDALVQQARAAVEAARGERSELRELWAEGDEYAVWETTVKDLLDRLNAESQKLTIRRPRRKRPLPLDDGDVLALDVGDGREGLLRVLYRWEEGETDYVWVYPDEAWSVPIEALTTIRPLAYVVTVRGVLTDPAEQTGLRRLGHCPLTPEERLLPIHEVDGVLHRRDVPVATHGERTPDQSRLEEEIRDERFPVSDEWDLGVPALVHSVREILGLEPQLMQRVVDMLQSPRNSDRRIATHGFAELGRMAAVPVIPHLIAALRDSYRRVRRGAARALGHVGYGRDEVRAALEATAQNDTDPAVRDAAVDALAALARGYYLP